MIIRAGALAAEQRRIVRCRGVRLAFALQCRALLLASRQARLAADTAVAPRRRIICIAAVIARIAGRLRVREAFVDLFFAVREHRDRRHRVDDLRDEDHRGDLAGVAAGLGALGDDDVGAGGRVAGGVDRRPAEGGDEDVFLMRALDQIGRWRSERRRDEADVVGEGDIEQGRDLVRRDRQAVPGALAFGQRRHGVALHDVVEESPVLGRQQRADCGPVDSAGVRSDVLRR